jgi:hypothetical protein
MTKTYEEYIAAIRQYESGSKYNHLNPDYGFAGAYQIIEDSLQRIGYYKGDATPKKNDWTGSWTGKNGISSISEFLNNPAAQDKAFLELQQWVWKTGFTDFNVKPYIGQTINGVTITESGLLAGAHLVGSPALLKYLSTQGANTPTDPYGTQVSKYIEMFNGYDVRPVTGTQTLSPIEPVPAPTPSTGEDTITVKISGTDYKGDPNFAFLVDGKVIDSTNLVTADHKEGEWQTFTFKGDFDRLAGDQKHKVGIQFTNNLSGAAGDRNLYVDEITFNGENNTTNQSITWNTTKYWDFVL